MRLYDYAASGNCYKVRLLLALLGTDYERVPVDIFGGDTLGPEYTRINPARETPVLELDDGTLISQSNAILCYLADGSIYLPGERTDRAKALQWLFFEQERVMGGIGGARFRSLTRRGGDAVAARFALGRTALEILGAHLEDRRYLVGQTCTVADLSNFAYTHVAGDAGYDLGSYPAVAAWLDRIRTEPGFMDDLVPYPDNALPGRSTSIYDA